MNNSCRDCGFLFNRLETEVLFWSGNETKGKVGEFPVLLVGGLWRTIEGEEGKKG